MSFKSLTLRDTELLTNASGHEVLHVFDPHMLLQAIGYLKFVHGQNDSEGIFLRGQHRLYEGLSPSLFRGLQKQEAQDKRIARLREVIDSFREDCPILSKFPVDTHEPLLQHYGLRTTWIDLVDNVWVALWFACQKAFTTGSDNQFLHFERKVASSEEDNFVYILLIATEINSVEESIPGLCIGSTTELIDLRMTCPSIFLRPHSQHGLLFRMRANQNGRPLDYADRIRGIIRISLNDAFTWLGDAKTLSVHTLFPPPFYDSGYNFLVSSKVEPDLLVGSIYHVGA